MARRPPLRIASALGALTLALLAGLAYTPVIGAVSRRLDTVPEPGPADVIVVLGAGSARDGVLSSPSLRRFLGGLILYRRGLAPRLILMGPAYEGSPIEAETRATLARDLAIPAEAIVVEGRGLTTRQEASLAAARDPGSASPSPCDAGCAAAVLDCDIECGTWSQRERI